MLNEANIINKYWSCRTFVISLLFSTALTASDVIGYYFFKCDILDKAAFYSYETVLQFSVTLIICVVLSYVAFYYACDSSFESKKTETKSLKSSLIYYSLFIFLCWIPYIVLRYPGIVHLDAIEQIIEIFYPKLTWYPDQIPEYDPDSGVILLNHHPILTTLVFAIFYKLGLVLGNVCIGLFAYTIIQAACLAFTFGLCLVYLQYCGINNILITVFCLFLALFPLNGLNATIIVKDNLFFICLILIQIGLVELLRNETAFLIDKRKCVAFGILMVFLSLTRHNGLYICIALMVIFFIVYHKKGRLLQITSSAAVVIVLIMNSLLFPAFGVISGSSLEAFSIPLQQMGRYIHEHVNDISSEDRIVIEECVKPDWDLERIAVSYQPYLSDGVKNGFKTNISSKEKQDLARIWAKWFVDDKKCFVVAAVNMIYPAFKTFSGEQGVEPDKSIITTKVVDEKNKAEFNARLHHAEKDVGVDRENMRFFQLSLVIDDIIIEKLMTTWGIRALFQMDFYVWLMFAVLSVLIIKRQYKSIIILSAVGINFLITLLGPIMYMRYFYPIACCLPLMISHALLLEEKSRETDDKQEE